MAVPPLAAWRTAPDPAAHRALLDAGRLDVLRATALLHGGKDEVLDRLTRVVSRILQVPIAAVSLVDDRGQSFAGLHGLGGWAGLARGTPLSHSFCQHVVIDDAPLVIDDAREDVRLRDNLAISGLGIISYAGVPLTTRDGETLGALCAIDTRPRPWSDDDLETLRDLAAAAVAQLQLRAALHDVASAHDVLRAEQERFGVEHDRLAAFDVYTGLLSRAGFEQAMHGTRSVGTLHTIEIGDHHSDSDRAVITVAAALSQVAGPDAICARVAPRELAAFVPNVGAGDDTGGAVPALEEQLRAVLQSPVGSLQSLTVRFGQLRLSAHATESPGVLLRSADTARNGTPWHSVEAFAMQSGTGDEGPRVLLLDEYPGVLAWARTTLQEHGCTVYTAIATDEALMLAANLREAGTPIDVIVADSAIRHVDGDLTGMLLRFDDPTVPIIRLSGGTPAVAVNPAEGASDVLLSKPVSPRALLACVVGARRTENARPAATQ